MNVSPHHPLNRKSPEERRDTIARKLTSRLHNKAMWGLSMEGVSLTPDESHDLYLDLVRVLVVALEKAQPRVDEENAARIKRNLAAQQQGRQHARPQSRADHVANVKERIDNEARLEQINALASSLGVDVSLPLEQKVAACHAELDRQESEKASIEDLL